MPALRRAHVLLRFSNMLLNEIPAGCIGGAEAAAAVIIVCAGRTGGLTYQPDADFAVQIAKGRAPAEMKMWSGESAVAGVMHPQGV